MSSERGGNARLTNRFVRGAKASEVDKAEGEARPGHKPLFGKYVIPHIGTGSLQLEEVRAKAIQNREHSALVLVISAVAKVYGLFTKWKNVVRTGINGLSKRN